jgi:hypothetical protein
MQHGITEVFGHLAIGFLMLLVVILIARAVVAGTKYSPILIIVVFGLTLGFVLELTPIVTEGLVEFPIIDLMGKTTIIALVVTFFVGGQKLRNTFGKPKEAKKNDVQLNKEEIMLGTGGTQFVFLTRAFFILIGIQSIFFIIFPPANSGLLGNFYPLIAFFGIAGSIILIDSKAKIDNKRHYLFRGITEIVLIIVVLLLAKLIAGEIARVIALPQIFFAMLLASGLGMVFSDWRAGPTIRSLLFGGIPMVLAGVFIVGGTRLLGAFELNGMLQVMAYGFCGQLFWMFVGISLLVFIGKSNNINILAPGMAGSLSHSGLTGACTAGDLGEVAAERAPIMINIPFFGHIFVFTILALSVENLELLVVPSLIVVALGVGLTCLSLKTLRNAKGEEKREISGLMLFSLGWQLVAVFGGFTLLHFAGMDLENAAMANSSAISHFGLFAAVQGGMFESVSSSVSSVGLISFIFAMPFLIHPVVFGMFGKAMSNKGEMPKKTLAALAFIGAIGVLLCLVFL